MSISSSAVLVELNMSVWTGQKIDRGITDKVTADNNAVRNAGQFKKNLMAGSSKRKEIADFAQSCRNWHATRTLPWADKGTRLLPTSLFLDYKAEANKREETFNRLVDEFLEHYRDHVDAARDSLGAMFDPDDYPSEEELRHKFAFSLVFSPVPEAGDFRLEAANIDMDAIRSQYESAFEQRVGDAMQSAWDKLHDMLEGMSAKLTEPDGDKGKRYHETLVTNAKELCSMLTHLNITADPKLEEARLRLQETMKGVDIEDIRESEDVRSEVKTKLDAVLSDFDW